MVLVLTSKGNQRAVAKLTLRGSRLDNVTPTQGRSSAPARAEAFFVASVHFCTELLDALYFNQHERTD